MAEIDFGTPIDKKVAAKVLQDWLAHPAKPIHTPPRVLPEGLSEAQFDGVLDVLRKVVGNENVLVGEDHRVRYSDPFQFETGEKDVGGSSCALTPNSVEQVQEIVRIANEWKLTLWTFSRGKNLGIFMVYSMTERQATADRLPFFEVPSSWI
jgi:4-cresol dehydrogenase (hydroxylating) flavoprotein subunit